MLSNFKKQVAELPVFSLYSPIFFEIMKVKFYHRKKSAKGESVTNDILDVVRDSQGKVVATIVFDALDEFFDESEIKLGIEKLVKKGYVIKKDQDLLIADDAQSVATERLRKMRENLRDQLSIATDY